MSKPIFIVRFPKMAEEFHLKHAGDTLEKQGMFEDYHVIVTKDSFADGEIQFECFNAPHTDIEFEELKERVLALIQN